MEIQLGQVFKWDKEMTHAIYMEPLGVLEAIPNKESCFNTVTLDCEQMLKLRNYLDEKIHEEYQNV